MSSIEFLFLSLINITAGINAAWWIAQRTAYLEALKSIRSAVDQFVHSAVVRHDSATQCVNAESPQTLNRLGDFEVKQALVDGFAFASNSINLSKEIETKISHLISRANDIVLASGPPIQPLIRYDPEAALLALKKCIQLNGEIQSDLIDIEIKVRTIPGLVSEVFRSKSWATIILSIFSVIFFLLIVLFFFASRPEDTEIITSQSIEKMPSFITESYCCL